mgnify:CR=1 FL=1
MIAFRLVVRGLVQGVGFRPYVAGLAKEMSISGSVYNAGAIVYINGRGEEKSVNDMICRLMLLDGNNDELPLANVTDIETYIPVSMKFSSANVTSKVSVIFLPDVDFDIDDSEGFSIVKSTLDTDIKRLLPADIATCPDCARQLFDSSDRRYRYPFISCASCGPRYSLMKSVPYDRENTSMSAFDMCPDCKKEYERIGDIRCYAQTIACDKCGPKLIGYDKDMSVTYKEDAFLNAVDTLKAGGIVAIKDPSGYHIAFDADNEVFIGARLRQYKNRENKPFAVMYNSVMEIKRDCLVSKKEEELLCSAARPIVLLMKRGDACFKDKDIIKGSNKIGAMLASNPLQLMLMKEFRCLVMTSGNISGMPVSVDDEAMLGGLLDGGIDYVLSNDRDILYGLDDSVVQVVKGHTQFIRRSRGYVPGPVKLPDRRLEGVRLSLGGDMKSSFAYGIDDVVYPGGYYGDIVDYECCMRRENGLDKAIGVAFDGTGYGDDATVWGGEFLVCDDKGYKRIGRISSVKLIGGDMSAKECIKTAMCYVRECVNRRYINTDPYANDDGYKTLLKAVDSDFNTAVSTSMGRLFDAVSAILDICLINTYESEAPMMVETVAEEYVKEQGEETCPVIKCAIEYCDNEKMYVADTVRLFADIMICWDEGVDVGAIAYSFHRAIADMVVDMLGLIYEKYGIYSVPVALSGGTMNNRLLLSLIIDRLDEKGYKYYINEQVEAGDGGLTLGQIIQKG